MMKMSNIEIGMQFVNKEDGTVWTVEQKDSKFKCVEIVNADGKMERRSLSYVNNHLEKVEVIEVEAEETQEQPVEVVEPKQKKERKHTRKTFEQLVADIPAFNNVRFIRNRKNEVIVKTDKKQIFRYTGKRLVCIREALVNGMDYTSHSYGHVVAPTVENMKKVYNNFMN